MISLNSKAYERDKFVNLGREVTEVDMSTPHGSVVFNKLQGCIMKDDYENVGNILAMHKAVKFIDGKARSEAVPYGQCEVSLWVDAKGVENRIESEVSAKAAADAGGTFNGTITRLKMTDGTIIDSDK